MPKAAAKSPKTNDPILAELRAMRAEQREHAERMERHLIAAVRGIALIQRDVRTYMEALAAAEDETEPAKPAANGKAHA